MKNLCLLAGVVVLIAGCASPSGTEPKQATKTARAYDDGDPPTGTLLRRKKSEKTRVESVEIDKQASQDY